MRSPILATAERLKAGGFQPLAILPNYFDDLEARLALEPEFTERLKTHNILYDRDADGGEYFQLFSPTCGEGFFIAAQKRALRPTGMPKVAGEG